MGEPYPSEAWAHYYQQATGGTYAPWPQFSQPQGYFHPGLPQEQYYTTPQQPRYDIYQTQWNPTCPTFSHQPPQQVDATTTSRKDTRDDEASTPNGDNYENLPMDISPNISPVKMLVTAEKQGPSGMVPIPTSAFTEAPTDLKSLFRPHASERPEALHAMKTLEMKFQCPDTNNDQSSVFSRLEECISCGKKILAVAKGQGDRAIGEPCTCERKSPPSDIPQRKPQSLGMVKTALEKPIGRSHVTKCANAEHSLQTDGRTTRDFERRRRTRWEPAAVSNVPHIEVSDQLPATRTTSEPAKPKPISIPSHVQQAAYIGSQGLGNSWLPRYSWKKAISKSAETVPSGWSKVPYCKISPESSHPVKTVMPEASHKSSEISCTVDICIGKTVRGAYIPDSEIDTSETTSINIKVDAKLGGCEEVMDEPVKLPSEVEKLDEGWVLSFD